MALVALPIGRLMAERPWSHEGSPRPEIVVWSNRAYQSCTERPDGAVTVWLGALRSLVLGSGHTARRGHGSRKFVDCPGRLWLPPAPRRRQGFARNPARVRGSLLPDQVSGPAMGWRHQDHVRHAGWIYRGAGPAQGLRCGHGVASRAGSIRDTPRTSILKPRLCNVVADGQQSALDPRAQVPSSHSRVDDGWRD
jgi:hypothetical protein